MDGVEPIRKLLACSGVLLSTGEMGGGFWKKLEGCELPFFRNISS